MYVYTCPYNVYVYIYNYALPLCVCGFSLKNSRNMSVLLFSGLKVKFSSTNKSITCSIGRGALFLVCSALLLDLVDLGKCVQLREEIFRPK